MIRIEPGYGKALWVIVGREDCRSIERVKQIPERRWHPEMKKWSIPATEYAVNAFCRLFADSSVEVHPSLLLRFPELQRFAVARDNQWYGRLIRGMKRRGYSFRTQKAYTGHMERFMLHAGRL